MVAWATPARFVAYFKSPYADWLTGLCRTKGNDRHTDKAQIKKADDSTGVAPVSLLALCLILICSVVIFSVIVCDPLKSNFYFDFIIGIGHLSSFF